MSEIWLLDLRIRSNVGGFGPSSDILDKTRSRRGVDQPLKPLGKRRRALVHLLYSAAEPPPLFLDPPPQVLDLGRHFLNPLLLPLPLLLLRANLGPQDLELDPKPLVLHLQSLDGFPTVVEFVVLGIGLALEEGQWRWSKDNSPRTTP